MSEPSKLRAPGRTPKALESIYFVAIVSIIEFVIAMLAYVRGLTDLYVLTLISLGVIAVLTSNWMYLTKKLAIGRQPSRKPSPRSLFLMRLISRVTSARITVKSAIIVLIPFLVIVLIPFSFRPSLKFLAWLTEVDPPQMLPTLEFMQSYIQSLMDMSFLRKYIYLQNVSAVASTLVTLLVGFLRGK